MNSQQKNITSFLIQYPDFFSDMVSQFYPLSVNQLVMFKEILNWQRISDNIHINWTMETIKQVVDCLNWQSFSTNPTAFKDITGLEVFDQQIDWLGNNDLDSLSLNTGLPWSLNFIERFKDRLNFEKLSANKAVRWSEELIGQYSDKWNFKELAMNESIPWNIRLFEKYLDTSMFSYHHVKSNKRLISDVPFIEKYSNYLDWQSIFSNPDLPWIELDLLNRWKQDINWSGIAANPFFFRNNSDFFYQNLPRWKSNVRAYSQGLSSNPALPWSIEFIEKHSYLWDWERISTNEHIPWTFEMIERLISMLQWGGCSPASLLDEEGNYISEFGGIEYNSGLIENESLPWSMDFIKHFEEFIDFESLADNKGVWEKVFKPVLNDEMIGTII